MGFSTSKFEITQIDQLIQSLAQDMVDGGFDLVWSDVPPERVSALSKSMIVKMDDYEADPTTYDFSRSSLIDPQAVGSITFKDGFQPLATVRKVTASFPYLRGLKNAYDSELVGTCDELNNIFATSSFGVDQTLRPDSFSLYFDGSEISTTDYTITQNLVTGKITCEVTNLSVIPSTTFKPTANFILENLATTKTWTVSTYITGARKIRTDPKINGTKLNIQIPVDTVTGLNVVTSLSFLYPRTELNKLTTVNGILCYADLTTMYNETIAVPRSSCDLIAYDELTKQYTFEIDLTAFSASDAEKIQFMVDNYAKSISYISKHPISTYYTGVLLPLDVVEILPATSNFLSANAESYAITTQINYALSGKASGYNDTFYTNILYKTVSPSNFTLYKVEVRGEDRVELVAGTDYNMSVISSGQAMIEFALTSIPKNNWIVTADFEYQPPGQNSVQDCILKGAIDGVNRTFDIGPRLTGDRFTLQAGEKVDPLFHTQPWRVHLDASYILTFLNNTLSPSGSNDQYPRDPPEIIRELGRIVFGTSYQLLDDGTVYDLYIPAGAPAQDYYIKSYDTSYEDFRNSTYGGNITSSRAGIYFDQYESSLTFPVPANKIVNVVEVLSLNYYKSKYAVAGTTNILGMNGNVKYRKVENGWDAIYNWRCEHPEPSGTGTSTQPKSLNPGDSFTFTEEPGYLYRYTPTAGAVDPDTGLVNPAPPDTLAWNYKDTIYKFTKDVLSDWSTVRPRFKLDGSEQKISLGNISPLVSELALNYSRPMSYTLMVSDHGFAVHFRTEAHPEGRESRFICCQRLVNAKTGKTLVDGLSPVVCIFSQMERLYQDAINQPPTKFPNSGEKTVWQMVVREKDIWAPSVPKLVTSDGSYMSGVWNSAKQMSIAENNSYIITIPDGITTDRHLYHNERLDLIGFVSANVIAEGMVADINLHGELKADNTKAMRHYTAQRCTIGYHEGARVMLLTGGDLL